MADDASGERQWIVEPPPAAGEISVYVAFGDEVELSAEQEAALSALLETLETVDQEVAAYECHNLSPCGLSDCTLRCGKVSCGGLVCTKLTKAISASGGAWNIMGSFGTRQ